MEVSIATVDDPLLSDRDVTVFTADMDVEHTVLVSPLSLNGVAWNTGREGDQVVTGDVSRNRLGLCVCV